MHSFNECNGNYVQKPKSQTNLDTLAFNENRFYFKSESAPLLKQMIYVFKCCTDNVVECKKISKDLH